MVQSNKYHLLKPKEILKFQNHVFNWFDELDESGKKSLINQANSINLENITTMFYESLQPKLCDINSIEQIPENRHIVLNDLSFEEDQFFFRTGIFLFFKYRLV